MFEILVLVLEEVGCIGAFPVLTLELELLLHERFFIPHKLPDLNQKILMMLQHVLTKRERGQTCPLEFLAQLLGLELCRFHLFSCLVARNHGSIPFLLDLLQLEAQLRCLIRVS